MRSMPFRVRLCLVLLCCTISLTWLSYSYGLWTCLMDDISSDIVLINPMVQACLVECQLEYHVSKIFYIVRALERLAYKPLAVTCFLSSWLPWRTTENTCKASLRRRQWIPLHGLSITPRKRFFEADAENSRTKLTLRTFNIGLGCQHQIRKSPYRIHHHRSSSHSLLPTNRDPRGV